MPVLVPLVMVLIASSRSAEREAPGSRGGRGPVPQALPALASCSLGSQPWRAPCASGVVPALSRRRPAACGNGSVGKSSEGIRLGAGRDQLLPRERGDPCSATFICRWILEPG